MSIQIVSTRLDFRISNRMSLEKWLGSNITPPHVITVEAIVSPELDDLTAAFVIEELIKSRVPEICESQSASIPELATAEWWVDNCFTREGNTAIIKHNGVYRNRDAIKPTSSDCARATFTLIPRIYAEMAHFQRSLWTLELPYLHIQGVPIYRMWTNWDSETGDVLYLHLKSREVISAIAVEAVYNWAHLGTPIDLAEVGEPAQRQYPTRKGNGGTIHTLEIAVPLNGTQLLVGNVITVGNNPTSSAEPTAPTPSCLNCLHFGGATPPNLEDPGEEDSCQHPDREGFPSVDSIEEDATLDLGGDAIWELYADGCPGYQPSPTQEPNLLQYGPGQEFMYPLVPQRADWVLPHELLTEQGPDLLNYLNDVQIRKAEVIRQVGGERSSIPRLTTIVVTTTEGDRTFQFNGAHIDEVVPAEGGKVKRVEVRNTEGDNWYDQHHLEVIQALHALENAIRRMMGIPEESWDDEPEIEEFGVPIVGIDPDAPECQQVFE